MIGPLITTAILSIKKFSVEGVEFQKLLEYSEKRIVWIHANFLPSLAFILFPCKNVTFYTKQDFSRALSFPHHTLFVFWLFFWFLSESTDCERKSLDFEGHQNLGKCDDIHTNIFTSKNLKWGWLRAEATQARHVRDLPGFAAIINTIEYI